MPSPFDPVPGLIPEYKRSWLTVALSLATLAYVLTTLAVAFADGFPEAFRNTDPYAAMLLVLALGFHASGRSGWPAWPCSSC